MHAEVTAAVTIHLPERGGVSWHLSLGADFRFIFLDPILSDWMQRVGEQAYVRMCAYMCVHAHLSETALSCYLQPWLPFPRKENP